MNVRRGAFTLIQKTFAKGGYSNFLFESFVRNREDISEKDKPFLKALYFGVLRQAGFLDYFLERKCSTPLQKLPDKILNILRIGLYQIIFMDRVPPHAAVSESVNLARKHGHAGTVKLVNAVLRALAKEPPEFFKIDAKPDSPISEIASALSHPEWMVKRYIRRFGFETAVEIFKANNDIPPKNYRVEDMNALKSSAIEFEPNRFNPIGVTLQNPPRDILEELVKKNAISPQDEASLITASLLAGAEGKILELCSGRGNKTAAIRKAASETASIFPSDLSKPKLKELKDRGLKNVYPFIANAQSPLPFKSGFSRVFLDAPCSSLGTIRRHPEVKYRKSEDDIKRHADLQLRLMENSARFVDDNGMMLYAVCSFEPEETEEAIERFLAGNGDFRPISIGERVPSLLEAGLVDGPFLRVLPGTNGMDGFFAALLQKKI